MLRQINNQIDSIIDNIISIRRDLHKNPGLSFQEHYAHDVVHDHLTELGIEIKDGIAETGIIGLIRGNSAEKTVGLRADMDALPIKEETNLEYSSCVTQKFENENVPVMHACGHDGHTAILIGTAYVLNELKQELNGNVKLIFQPAEEKGAGGEIMVMEGALEDPDVMLNLLCIVKRHCRWAVLVQLQDQLLLFHRFLILKFLEEALMEQCLMIR